MSYLLDTNIVSEWVKPRPNPGVVAWLTQADEDRIFLSVVTLAELRHGTERMPAGARRDRLDRWLSDAVPARFGDRILPIDHAVADAWGMIVARRYAIGRPIGTMDAFTAASAAVHDLRLVTRNQRHFQDTPIELINPWSG